MTKVMLAQCSILTWQSFIRTSYSLVVWTGRGYPGQAILAWRNPARTNQYLETLNWHCIWYKPRTTIFLLFISNSRDEHMWCTDFT